VKHCHSVKIKAEGASMATRFEPKLTILPEQQRRLWSELNSVPQTFRLCGGTAIALHLGHRSSVDFDFISTEKFDPDWLLSEVSFLRGSRVVQKAANTLTSLVDRGKPVQVSFFGAPSIQFVDQPLVSSDNGLCIASLLDLAGMKAAVVQKRAEAKDYMDLDAIIDRGQITLPMALTAARTIYGRAFNPELTLKSLCYFGDGDLNTLPRQIQDRLAAAVAATDLNQLPEA
jgi:hypothetical protein